jgi:hypothetical protein
VRGAQARKPTVQIGWRSGLHVHGG